MAAFNFSQFFPFNFLLFFIVCAVFCLIILHFRLPKKPKGRVARKSPLTKHQKNPVIAPPEFADWEAIGTFNPATIHDDDGRVHMVYRAIGADGVSRFGYAMSEDGQHFSERSPYPIFTMLSPQSSKLKHFEPVLYPSGGSWGGAEDPRLVRMEGKIYMTFNAFDGWDFIRMAVTSIAEDDFFNKRWKWTRPLYLSAPGTTAKNWVLFPEKINGKFAIIHSIVPEILIEFVDNLDGAFQPIISPRKGGPQPGRKDYWDNWMRGAGAPPLKTDKGWLLFYHATGNEDSRYQVGAMLLDLNNPSKIIARSPMPLLLPDEWYENDWKPGIVYVSGALVRGNDLYIYYGGGDKHVCVAHTPLKELLNSLV